MRDPEGPRFGSFLEAGANDALVARRDRGEDEAAAGRRAGEGRDETEDDVELERAAVDAVLAEGYGVARRSSESLRSIFLRAWIILRLRLALGFS
jgi:hypothetical protein